MLNVYIYTRISIFLTITKYAHICYMYYENDCNSYVNIWFVEIEGKKYRVIKYIEFHYGY